MIPTEAENPTGLNQRYQITKASGEPCDPRAVYFVLRLDDFGDDKDHINACRSAAMAYADYVQSGETPHLAGIGSDLRSLLAALGMKKGAE